MLFPHIPADNLRTITVSDRSLIMSALELSRSASISNRADARTVKRTISLGLS
jgi:hypothetical protein